jgi:hypothetical protein
MIFLTVLFITGRREKGKITLEGVDSKEKNNPLIHLGHHVIAFEYPFPGCLFKFGIGQEETEFGYRSAEFELSFFPSFHVQFRP